MQFSSNLVEKHNAKFLVAFASQGSDIWSIIVRLYYSNQYNYAKPFKLDYQLDIESTQIIKYVSICNDKLAHWMAETVRAELNPNKTEFLIILTKKNGSKFEGTFQNYNIYFQIELIEPECVTLITI